MPDDSLFDEPKPDAVKPEAVPEGLTAAALEDVDGRALDRRVQIKFMQAISKEQLALNK